MTEPEDIHRQMVAIRDSEEFKKADLVDLQEWLARAIPNTEQEKLRRMKAQMDRREWPRTTRWQDFRLQLRAVAIPTLLGLAALAILFYALEGGDAFL